MAHDRKVALRRMLLACCVLSGLAGAALFPPASALPRLAVLAPKLMLAWFYFCSMLVGAAPFLAAGAVAAAAAMATQRSPAFAGRLGPFSLALFAVLFPGCDCAMNAYAPSLRNARPRMTAWVIVWASCCNPLALYCTATILGPRMLCARMIAAAVAAMITARAWSKLPPLAPVHGCGQTPRFCDSFVRLAGGGIASFASAAGVSAAFLTFGGDHARLTEPLAAAVLGAILSPCSSADALLARVLFNSPAAQLAFVISSQCLDVRQILLVRRCFGAAHALRAVGAAVLGCAVGCLLVAR